MKLYIDKFGNITKTEEVGLISGSWGKNFIDFYYQEDVTYASINAIRNDSVHIKNLLIPKTQRMYDTEQNLYFWRYEVEENDPLISVAGQLELSVNFVSLVKIDDIAEKESVVASISYVTRVRKSVGSESEDEYNDFLQALGQYTEQVLASQGGVADNTKEINNIKQQIEIINQENLKIFLIYGNTINDELYQNLIAYNENACLYYREVPNATLCYLLANDEKTLIYRGNVITNETKDKTLTITIDKETKAIAYNYIDNIAPLLEPINEDITLLKENVNNLISGGALVAGGWVKIEGTLKPQEVNALYSTKGTGLYTITSEEYGKETIFIDTAKGMFKRQTGMYDYTYNFDTGNWEILASGTGGGGGTSGAVILTNKTPLEATAAVGGEYKIQYEYTSTQDTKGTAQYYIDGTLRRTQAINTGTNEFDVSEYIIAGERVVKVEVSDRYGNSNSITFLIIGIELKLESKFSDSRAYSGVIDFRYTPYGTIAKNVKLYIDDKLYKEEVVYVTGEEQAINVSGLTHDVHKFRLEMNAIIGGTTIESNDLNYSVIYVVEGNNQILISSKFDKKTATQGELLNVDYLVYNPLSEYTNIDLSINGEVVNELSVGRSRQYWNLTNYPIGDLRLEIIANAEEENTQTKTFNLSVTSAEINVNPVTTNLQLYLSAQNRSNSEPITERVKWKYNDVTATLNNFNWSTNGWVTDKKGNNLLRLNGKANVYIPFNIFGTDFLSLGKTIEFDFATTDIYDITKLLVSCYANDKGFQITSNDAILKSEQTEVSTKFKENERVRVSFVIQSTASTRLVKTFINGECCGLAQYPDSDEFKQANPVGITINNLEGSIDIYSIRIYNQDLNDRQMLNNYMSDLSFNDKIAAYTRNNILDDYGQVAYSKVKPLIPILIITGNLPTAKGDKKIVKALYENPFDSSKNFSYDGVEIDIQGTSSQFYPRKNYKLKFPTAFSFKNNAVEEKTYTFKADYMESSHSHNTGNAKFINSISPQFPTQASNSNVRNTIDGFPIVIFVRSSDSADLEYYGVFNFNNDKGNKDTLGLTTPYAESWEFKNNISSRCLFRSDDLSEKVEDDFEARYPKDYKDYTKLQRVLSWVVSTEGNVEKFKEEIETYFNKEFCLFYYVMMEVMLAVDSRAKNMFLDTIDGVIWYPRWYDIDTTYGLNNEGVNQFGYGLEQHDFIGDVAVFNGENSLLWNNFEEAFGDEIKQYYYDLRSNGKLSYEAIYNVIYGEQISKISQAMYNTDGSFKYIGPVIEDNDTTYLYVEQGSRLNHFQWWLSNRIKYLDSKYEYAEFKDDFISMRTYTPDDYVVAPTNYFELKPFSDMYLQVLFGSSTIRERAIANVSERVSAPSGLKFNNTETIIYGASRILDVGDLSTKYARTMDFSKALKLKRLQIGNETIGYQNTNLNELTIGNNTMLEYLDIRNCPNLTQSIDLTGCLNIKEVYASGTNIAAVNLASGGNLTTLQLPASVSNLVLVNQPLLTNFSMPSYSNVKSLRLENVAVESLPIVRQATELERVRLIDINWVLRNEEQIILNNLLDVRGFNADGSSTDKAVLTGRIHIQGLVGDRSLKAWNKYFNNQETIEPINPNVVITADEIGLTHLVRFLDYKGDVIEEKIVGHNTFTTYTGATPTKPTNETLKEKYTFSNWNPSLLTPITQDTDFIPQFTITKYYQYIFVNGNGNEIYRGYADNGTLVTYTNPLVPYKAENTELQERYEFNGTWSPSLNTPISADTIYTPNFTITKYWRYTFINGDNSIIYSGFADNGTRVNYDSDVVPSRAENVEEQIEYIFNGNWTPSLDREIEENTTYQPDFTRKQYYYVEFRNYDNTLLQRTKVYKGESVEYTGEEPTRPDEDGSSYTFEGWDVSLENIQSNLIAIAQYKSGKPIIIELDLVDSSKLSPTLNYSFGNTLPFIVNWGDGTEEEITPYSAGSSQLKHTYSTIGKYTIKIFPNVINSGVINDDGYGYRKYMTKVSLVSGLTESGVWSGSQITEFIFPKTITTITDYAFDNCANLIELFIPKNITTIQTHALRCGSSTNKATFTFESETPPSINGSSFNIYNLNEIRVPSSAVEAYKTATNWTNFASKIVGY